MLYTNATNLQYKANKGDMPSLFHRETEESAIQKQDLGKLAEIDNHQLLKTENNNQQIASFNQVKQLGEWFLQQKYNIILASDKPLPTKLLSRHQAEGNKPILGKIKLAEGSQHEYPVTIEVVTTPYGQDLRLHIVPINFESLEVAQFAQHTDSLLALAAAAAVAPQFLMALEGGIETTICSTKKDTISSITPDHGTPLAVTFDTFASQSNTLVSATRATGNLDLNIKQAAHLHGQNKPSTEMITQAAAGSKIAAGVKVRTLLRSQLTQKHGIAVILTKDLVTGAPKFVSMEESLLSSNVGNLDMSLIAATLGFTAQVVGDSKREQTIETVLSPVHAETPLRRLVP